MKKFEFDFYNKLTGYLIKKGKKKSIQKTLNKSFFSLCKIFNYKPSFLLLKIFLLLETYIEAKTFKKRRKILVIPFPLKTRRRLHLVLKWYISSIFNCTSKTSLFNKIVKVTSSILLKKRSKAFALQKTNYKLSVFNRANMHFRW